MMLGSAASLQVSFDTVLMWKGVNDFWIIWREGPVEGATKQWFAFGNLDSYPDSLTICV